MANGINTEEKDLLQLLRGFVQRGVQSSLEQNPLVAIAKAAQNIGTGAGVASTLIPGKAGEISRVTKEISSQLNPMQENVIKAVQKVQTKNVEEAMEQGASGEQVLADAGISFGANQPQPEVGEDGTQSTDALSLALTGVQPPELAGQFEREGGFLHRPFQVDPGTGAVHPEQILGGLIKAHPNVTATALENLIRGQKITGKVPIQEGEIEKIGLEGLVDLQKELAKVGDVKALTPENAGKFQLLIEGFKATETIDQLLGDNVTLTLFAQGIPTFLKSQNARLLESAITLAVNDRTRIETGAVLAPSELKTTAKAFMPKKGDSIDTALSRLKPLRDYFLGAVNIADPTGIHRQRAAGQGGLQTIGRFKVRVR